LINNFMRTVSKDRIMPEIIAIKIGLIKNL